MNKIFQQTKQKYLNDLVALVLMKQTYLDEQPFSVTYKKALRYISDRLVDLMAEMINDLDNLSVVDVVFIYNIIDRLTDDMIYNTGMYITSLN